VEHVHAGYFRISIFLLVGDVLIGRKRSAGTLSILRIYRLSLSKGLVGVGSRAYFHIGECACVYPCVIIKFSFCNFLRYDTR